MKEFIELKKLSLHNFATFERQDIQFSKGFNIIVGETGSGKSLIFDALQLVLGNRADKRLVRTKSPFACVEAFFQYQGNGVKEYLDSIGYPSTNDEIVIKRIIYPVGKTKAFINYQQCNLNALSEFSKRFVDLVGQFENQKLLSPNYQLKLIDHYAQNQKSKNEYSDFFQKYSNELQRKKELSLKIGDQEQRLDYIDFQIKEIEKVSPEENEEEDLIKKKDLILKKSNVEKTIGELQSVLSESDQSLLNSMNYLQKTISKHSDIFSEINQEELSNHIAYFEDLSFSLNNFSLDDESENLDFLIDRIDQFQKLKRKFGPSINNVLENYEAFKKERDELLNIRDLINTIEEKVHKIKENLKKSSQKLSETRKIAAKNLSRKLTKEIQNLNMLGATIDIRIHKGEDFSSSGSDTVTIFAETNPGEGFYPLQKIASGGELSRILLSLRQSLASSDSVSIFFFDEVDSGIGGETALLIGKVLKEVSKSSQVIAITHLPQIASQADQLIKVQKRTKSEEKDLRTVSEILEVSGSSLIKKQTQEMMPVIH